MLRSYTQIVLMHVHSVQHYENTQEINFSAEAFQTAKTELSTLSITWKRAQARPCYTDDVNETERLAQLEAELARIKAARVKIAHDAAMARWSRMTTAERATAMQPITEARQRRKARKAAAARWRKPAKQ